MQRVNISLPRETSVTPGKLCRGSSLAVGRPDDGPNNRGQGEVAEATAAFELPGPSCSTQHAFYQRLELTNKPMHYAGRMVAAER